MKKGIKRVGIIVLAFCMLALSITGCAGSKAEEVNSGDIIVLFTNDVHCAVDDNLGYASLAAYKSLMEGETEYVTLADLGDAIQGEAAGAVSQGEYITDIMNAVGYDLAVLGNHEFDYGVEQLSYLIDKSEATYLACNMNYLGTGESLADQVKPYEILSYGDVQVAYIGVATPETMTRSAKTLFQDEDGNYLYDFYGSDETEFYGVVQGYVDECRDEGADYVILLTHLGVLDSSSPYTSKELIAATTGVDAVLDGHSHTVISSAVVKNADGDPVVLSSTGTKLENIGRLTITESGDISTTLISEIDYTDDETAAALQEIQKEYKKTFSEFLIESEVTLTVESESGIREVRNRETNTGDFCADAYRAVTGADVAFVNGGGIRTGLDKGEVTFEDLINISPFGNELCMVEATGQQILDALEMSYRYVESKQNNGVAAVGEKGSFLQVSGLKFTIDTSVPVTIVTDEDDMFVSVEGEYRVQDVQVLQEDETWADLELDKTYTVASHNFIMEEAGEGMNMFLEDEFLIQEGISDFQVLINYVQDYLGGVIGSEYEKVQDRITVK